MNICLPKTFAALTALSLLSSCANIQDDGTRTRTEGALAGSVLGGIAGGIIGHQSGRGWEGAAIGATAGGLAGLAYGNHVANKKAAYASQEAWLDACIARATQVNRDAVAYNNRLSNRIASLRSQIAAARASNNKVELRKLQSTVTTLRKETRQQVQLVESEIDAQDEVVNETGSSNLRSRVSTLKSTRSSLRSNEERLADLGNQIDV
jgi:uncharacterized membrane protein YebE (DUF533 family)